jgi:hypothetical protein
VTGRRPQFFIIATLSPPESWQIWKKLEFVGLVSLNLFHTSSTITTHSHTKIIFDRLIIDKYLSIPWRKHPSIIKKHFSLEKQPKTSPFD